MKLTLPKLKKLNSLGATHMIVPIIAVVVIGGIGTYLLGINHADAAVPNLTCSATWSPSGSVVNPSGATITAKVTFGNNSGGETATNYYTSPVLAFKTMSLPQGNQGNWYVDFDGSLQDFSRQNNGAISFQSKGQYSSVSLPFTLDGATSPGYIQGLTHGQTAVYNMKSLPMSAKIVGSGQYSVTLELAYDAGRGGGRVCSSKTYNFE